MSRFTSMSLILLLSGVWAGGAAGQGVAFEGGVGLALGQSFLQVGLRASSVRSVGVGIDFALATSVDGLINGAFNALSDLDVDYHARLADQARVSLRVGGSAVVGSSAVGSAAFGGVNAGVGLISQVGKRTSVRMDFTHRWFFGSGGSVGISSLTLGIAIGY